MSLSRDPAVRIASLHRYGEPITEQQRADARALLTDLLAAAEKYGVTLADFDGAIDLPGGCVDVITDRDARNRRRGDS